jgi:hypothetical protein
MTAVVFRLACEGKGMAGPSFWSFSAKDEEPPAPAMHEQRVIAGCRCKPAADRGLLDIARAARAFRLVHDLALVETVRPYLVERRSAIRPKGHLDWHGPQRRQLFVQWTIWFVRVRKPHRC